MPIDFNLANVDYQGLAKTNIGNALELKKLQQKEGSEARQASIENDRTMIAQQQADTDQQRADQAGQYQQAMAQQGQQRLNLDGTRDLTELALKAQQQGFNQEKANQAMDMELEKFGWAKDDRAKQNLIQEGMKKAAEGGIEGQQQFLIKMGMPEEALNLSKAQAELQKGILDNEQSVFKIKDAKRQEEAAEILGSIRPAISSIAGEQNDSLKDQKAQQFAEDLYKITDGKTDLRGHDTNAILSTAVNLAVSTEKGIAAMVSDPNMRVANADWIAAYASGANKTPGSLAQSKVNAALQAELNKNPSSIRKLQAERDIAVAEGRSGDAAQLSKQIDKENALTVQQGGGVVDPTTGQVIDTTQQNKTEQQKEMTKQKIFLNQLDRIEAAAKDEFFTIGNEFKSDTGKALQRIGIPAWEESVRERTAFITQLNNLENAYIKDLGGANITPAEFERLRSGMINGKMSAVEFKQAFKDMKERIQQEFEIRNASAGGTVQSDKYTDEQKSAIDAAYAILKGKK